MPALAGGGGVGMSNIIAFPRGGRVSGAGTSVSDSINSLVPEGSYVIKASSANKLRKNRLVKLSKDEEVIPPEVVSHLGKDFFDKVNKTGEVKFSEGGFLGTSMAGNMTPLRDPSVSSSSSVTNIFQTTIHQKDNENSDDVSRKVATELMRKIAKQEADKSATKHVSIYDKQQKTNKRRSV
jgi:hypothetical protein